MATATSARESTLSILTLSRDSAGTVRMNCRRLLKTNSRSPQLRRNLWPPVEDCSQVSIELPSKKQARNKSWIEMDRIYPMCVRKCLCFLHFLIAPRGSRTYGQRATSPMRLCSAVHVSGCSARR